MALQILLNRKNKNRVITDGTFGPLTSGAVDEVREVLGVSTGPKGVADPGLCRLLVKDAGLQSIELDRRHRSSRNGGHGAAALEIDHSYCVGRNVERSGPPR